MIKIFYRISKGFANHIPLKIKNKFNYHWILEPQEKRFVESQHFPPSSFAFYLLSAFQKFSLTSNITTITLGSNIFSNRRDCLSSNNIRANSTLNGYSKLLPCYFIFQLLQIPIALVLALSLKTNWESASTLSPLTNISNLTKSVYS